MINVGNFDTKKLKYKFLKKLSAIGLFCSQFLPTDKWNHQFTNELKILKIICDYAPRAYLSNRHASRNRKSQLDTSILKYGRSEGGGAWLFHLLRVVMFSLEISPAWICDCWSTLQNALDHSLIHNMSKI